MSDFATPAVDFEPSDTLATWVKALVDGEATSKQHAGLGDLLAADPAARRWFVEYMQLHASLTWDSEDLDDSLPEVASLGHSSLAPTLLSGIFHSTVGHFSSGSLVAYLVATVVFGIGFLIGSLIPANRYTHTAKTTLSPGALIQYEPELKMPFVGRITGMIDCRWSDPQTKAVNGANVPLGRKYTLRSGLMEITYDTGATVILQGPVTYEVESNCGGYLSVGKLTARIEKKEERRTRNEELSASRSSFLIPHSYFAVRTPTATVIDLGTEFGVDVSSEGLTEVHVLRGAVDAQIIGPSGDTSKHEQVAEGQAVQIKPQSTKIETVAFAPQSFSRKLSVAADTAAEAAYIKAVLADKPLGYWPLNERAGARKFFDRSGNGFHGYAMNRVMAGQAGLLDDSRAVSFDGNGHIDAGRHDEFALVNDFTLEAWVCIGPISQQLAARVISATPYSTDDRGGRMFGWALEASRKADQNGELSPASLRLSTYGVKDYELTLPNEMTSSDQWIHVAVVCDRDNTAHFYLNGKRWQSITAEKPGNRGPVWMEIGGGTINADEFWRGRLAHLAVYAHTLSAQQIENHYNQRKAA